ncbi:Nif3-like dinuclear metal center hexameric protein [Gracilibacillus caseinilyticus]|uniref:GTP cyclohydrolase 1 type 2 homolog n=1 Tax=Gracilibacillus caseinilyticus TaxID=2932256 RepID=A0ABY4EX13_9BACI|nr:Nif3-like dinuclear metal center hexameric protein [Gracilibacillus caseinilyticus]UOQ48378.1 Nif3-like dinuclear metal center hexameric protein [Gracilibacillus caseinilyticus]
MLTVDEVIKILKQYAPLIENSSDALLYGKPEQDVSKIVVTFMPTIEVIQQAIQSNADLLICHEGIYYSHQNNLYRENNIIYQRKHRLIVENDLAIFRLHDHIHQYRPDGIMQGLIDRLRWQNNLEIHRDTYSLFKVADHSLSDIIQELKQKLVLPYVRYIGDLSKPVERIALMVGFRGNAANTIPACEVDQADLVIYGEGPEWETPEYIRDAITIGENKAAIIIGHLESEESGMKYISELLRTHISSTSITYQANKRCISFA